MDRTNYVSTLWVINEKIKSDNLSTGTFNDKGLKPFFHPLMIDLHWSLFSNQRRIRLYNTRDRFARGWLRVWSLFGFAEFGRFRSLFAKALPKSWKIYVFRRKNDSFSKFSAPTAPKIGHFSILVTSPFGGSPPSNRSLYHTGPYLQRQFLSKRKHCN